MSTPIAGVLFQDVALWGDVTAPMLSWLGGGGILLIFLWLVLKLFWDIHRTRRPFVRMRATLISLGKPAESADAERLSVLDDAMGEEPMFRAAWAEFRETFLIDHVQWYRTPRIHTTRLAEEYFTHDSLLGSRLNLGLYAYVPAMLTGLGLLLTFLAFFIGLSKLHAEGHTVSGIQGLINGLSGKFLTSIVGLVCATLFALLEKPLVHHLTLAYREFLDLLNGAFTRRTTEQILGEINLRQSEQVQVLKYLATDLAAQFKKSLRIP